MSIYPSYENISSAAQDEQFKEALANAGLMGLEEQIMGAVAGLGTMILHVQRSNPEMMPNYWAFKFEDKSTGKLYELRWQDLDGLDPVEIVRQQREDLNDQDRQIQALADENMRLHALVDRLHQEVDSLKTLDVQLAKQLVRYLVERTFLEAERDELQDRIKEACNLIADDWGDGWSCVRAMRSTLRPEKG